MCYCAVIACTGSRSAGETELYVQLVAPEDEDDTAARKNNEGLTRNATQYE